MPESEHPPGAGGGRAPGLLRAGELDQVREENTVNAELGWWLALRRVRRGGIAEFARGVFLDRGRPVPDYIGTSLAALLAEGCIQTGLPQESTGYLPLVLTSAGKIRYADLAECYQHQRRMRAAGPR